MIQDDPAKMTQYIEENFKKAFPEYASQEIQVESFSDSYSYYASLVSAFLSGNGPDIFMIENTESSVFENQIRAIDPEVLSPNDFRVRFQPVF